MSVANPNCISSRKRDSSESSSSGLSSTSFENQDVGTRRNSADSCESSNRTVPVKVYIESTISFLFLTLKKKKRRRKEEEEERKKNGRILCKEIYYCPPTNFFTADVQSWKWWVGRGTSSTLSGRGRRSSMCAKRERWFALYCSFGSSINACALSVWWTHYLFHLLRFFFSAQWQGTESDWMKLHGMDGLKSISLFRIYLFSVMTFSSLNVILKWCWGSDMMIASEKILPQRKFSINGALRLSLPFSKDLTQPYSRTEWLEVVKHIHFFLAKVFEKF